MEITLQPGDILVWESSEKGIIRRIKHFITQSDRGHVSVFWGFKTPGGDELCGDWDTSLNKKFSPLHCESIGRGQCKTELLKSAGRHVDVYRYKTVSVSTEAAIKMNNLVLDGDQVYDYWCIFRYAIPSILWHRISGKWCGFGYARDSRYICSEAADFVYDYRFFSRTDIPTFPWDYEYAKGLKLVASGVLTTEGAIV
jgi:hypothetical protein